MKIKILPFQRLAFALVATHLLVAAHAWAEAPDTSGVLAQRFGLPTTPT